jgi:hypothetical protein
MIWNKWIRQIHRWLSIAFTLGVVVNGFNVADGHPAYWVYFLALVPLFLLLFTGLYLFALPHVARWRAPHGADGYGEEAHGENRP